MFVSNRTCWVFLRIFFGIWTNFYCIMILCINQCAKIRRKNCNGSKHKITRIHQCNIRVRFRKGVEYRCQYQNWDVQFFVMAYFMGKAASHNLLRRSKFDNKLLIKILGFLITDFLELLIRNTQLWKCFLSRSRMNFGFFTYFLLWREFSLT